MYYNTHHAHFGTWEKDKKKRGKSIEQTTSSRWSRKKNAKIELNIEVV